MESSITVILKEIRGFDRAFQLMYQPCPIWTQNEEWIEDNTKIGFGMKGRFKALLDYCQNNGHVLSDENECVVLCRKEMAKNSYNEVQKLIRDIADNGYKYTLLEY